MAMEREMAATHPKPKPLEKAPQPFMLYVFFDCETIYTDINSVDVLCDMCICVVGKTVCVILVLSGLCYFFSSKHETSIAFLIIRGIMEVLRGSTKRDVP